MDSSLQSRIDLFLSNEAAAREGFRWQNALIRRLAALLFASENRSLDVEAVRGCHAQIKAATGLFSTFRGNSALSAATMLALASDPQRLLDDALTVYEQLKRAGFCPSDFLVTAALLIAQHARERASRKQQEQAAAGPAADVYWQDAGLLDPFSLVVARTRAFYEGMKQAHWFITGQDDTIFSAMLGLSDLDVEQGVARVSQYFDDLRPEFWGGNSVQALAQVLALGGPAEGLSIRVLNLADGFRNAGLRLDRAHTLSTLGVLALLPQDRDSVVHAVWDAYDYLRQQPHFGAWSLGKEERLLYAASLFAIDSATAIARGLLSSTLTTSITSIIIAQQAAMASAIAASTAASASASSAHG